MVWDTNLPDKIFLTNEVSETNKQAIFLGIKCLVGTYQCFGIFYSEFYP
jgi:hypothetical protein